MGREPQRARAAWDAHAAAGLLRTGAGLLGTGAACSFPAGSSTVFPLPWRLPIVPDHVRRRLYLVSDPGLGTCALPRAAAGKQERGLAVEEQDSKVGEHKGCPVSTGSKKGREIWRGLKRESIKARETDKGTQASPSFQPAPASLATSARPTCHQRWWLSQAPLHCVGSCSSLGGGGEERELQKELERSLRT